MLCRLSLCGVGCPVIVVKRLLTFLKSMRVEACNARVRSCTKMLVRSSGVLRRGQPDSDHLLP